MIEKDYKILYEQSLETIGIYEELLSTASRNYNKEDLMALYNKKKEENTLTVEFEILFIKVYRILRFLTQDKSISDTQVEVIAYNDNILKNI
jgi:hypothetical protein